MIWRLTLVGMMGAGKSVVARELRRRDGIPYVDLDERIEEGEGRSIPEIFEREGEPYFREVESRYLREVCRDFEGTLATGGGIVLTEENRRLLRRWGKVIYLRAEPETLAARLGGKHAGARPLLRGSGGLRRHLAEMLAERAPLYEQADYVIDTDGLSAEEIGRQIASLLGSDRGTP